MINKWGGCLSPIKVELMPFAMPFVWDNNVALKVDAVRESIIHL